MVQSPDKSYKIVPWGLWTYVELSIGICISCLPVIPRFFQNISPKLSSALTTLKIKSTTKDFVHNGFASAAKSPSSQRAKAEKLKLPSFKHTFTSLFSSDAEEQDDHELYDQQSIPKSEYALLHKESAVPKRDDSMRELSQMPPVNLATKRDDLEKGRG